MPPKCPRCGSPGTFPIAGTKTGIGQRWECADCDKHFFSRDPKAV